MRRPAALLLTTALAARALEPTQLWPTRGSRSQPTERCPGLAPITWDRGATTPMMASPKSDPGKPLIRRSSLVSNRGMNWCSYRGDTSPMDGPKLDHGRAAKKGGGVIPTPTRSRPELCESCVTEGAM